MNSQDTRGTDKDAIQSEKTYDSVFWTGVVKMTRYCIPLVNEAFGEHFTDQATVTLRPMKQVTRKPDAALVHGEVDSLATLSETPVTRDYHFEMEAWGKNGIAIRIVEYAAGSAYDSAVLTEHGAKMVIPYSAAIVLRSSESLPDKLIIEIEYPGGKASYEVPVLKMEDYSIEELFEKRLLLLVPFFGFAFEGKFADMETGGIDELKDALDEINARLTGMVESGEIDESQKNHLIDWTKRVLQKLTIKYRNVSKEVDEIMGGYILHTRTDDILDAGRAEGRAEGIAKGRAEGRAEGTEETAGLMSYLVQNGRSADVVKAANDKGFLNKLLAEFRQGIPGAAVSSASGVTSCTDSSPVLNLSA